MTKELRARSVPKDIREKIEKILSPGHRLLHEIFLAEEGTEPFAPIESRERWYEAQSTKGRIYIIHFDGSKYNNTENRRYDFLFSSEGEKLSVKKLEDYIMVTDFNEKDMIKEGRIIHIIQNKTLHKTILIYPCDRMGKKATPNFLSQSDIIKMSTVTPEDYNLWKDWWRGLVDMCKKRKCLFVNKKEKLVTFNWK